MGGGRREKLLLLGKLGASPAPNWDGSWQRWQCPLVVSFEVQRLQTERERS